MPWHQETPAKRCGFVDIKLRLQKLVWVRSIGALSELITNGPDFIVETSVSDAKMHMKKRPSSEDFLRIFCCQVRSIPIDSVN